MSNRRSYRYLGCQPQINEGCQKMKIKLIVIITVGSALKVWVRKLRAIGGHDPNPFVYKYISFLTTWFVKLYKGKIVQFNFTTRAPSIVIFGFQLYAKASEH